MFQFPWSRRRCHIPNLCSAQVDRSRKLVGGRELVDRELVAGVASRPPPPLFRRSMKAAGVALAPYLRPFAKGRLRVIRESHKRIHVVLVHNVAMPSCTFARGSENACKIMTNIVCLCLSYSYMLVKGNVEPFVRQVTLHHILYTRWMPFSRSSEMHVMLWTTKFEHACYSCWA